MADGTCSVSECQRPPERRGMCGMHYQRQWKRARSCSIEGCDRIYAAKTMCVLHYKRVRNGISFDAPILGAGKAAGCAVEGCDQPYHGNGYCGAHLQRVYRTGDPEGFTGIQREAQCSADGCDLPHNGLGFCVSHYNTWKRYGTLDPEFHCKACGARFDRTGSYVYCGDCHPRLPAGYRKLRLDRLAANNAGMSNEDRDLSNEYQALLRADPCVYCGQPSTAIDHIEPVVRGGSDRWDNLAPICKVCNSSKRSKPLLAALLARLESQDESRTRHQVPQRDPDPVHRRG
jgi:hypothetical protein